MQQKNKITIDVCIALISQEVAWNKRNRSPNKSFKMPQIKTFWPTLACTIPTVARAVANGSGYRHRQQSSKSAAEEAVADVAAAMLGNDYDNNGGNGRWAVGGGQWAVGGGSGSGWRWQQGSNNSQVRAPINAQCRRVQWWRCSQLEAVLKNMKTWTPYFFILSIPTIFLSSNQSQGATPMTYWLGRGAWFGHALPWCWYQ